jgi:ubiquinone/menaquinone biosynthesis C-methylase UbiE
MSGDSPYPEVKKSHSMARLGRPWRDHKPPPSGPVWAVIQGLNNYWALVAAIDLGVFDALAEAPLGEDALAQRLEVSALHLRHLLDVMVTMGFLEQLSGVYALTETAERYLCTDGAASMAALVRVSPGPLDNWLGLAETIRTGTVASPIDDAVEAVYAPLVKATFATQFRAASRLGLKLGWQRSPGLKVLDLGAGCAPWALALLAQSEGACAVINDWPEILVHAREEVGARAMDGRCEYLPGSFHDVAIPADSFDVVVLGHVCRTEGPELAPALLARAAAALKPGGKLLVADYYADNERRLNPFGVQMGMTMLANTRNGQALTHEQMVCWLREQYLEAIRLLEPIPFNTVYVAEKP